ncbi:GDSL esterase/lipase [Tripterygium wilfordii]|uniref:GDSL esterase/lipase n=1 Tax=Tripterygium wilfordii TaxID=458696 RepID=A0A7J7D8H1_TRIWF|nr:GDSL esterase/lipase At5g03610-like [Tripterygium wilfordii]KAF5742611.1 GDSL esterase/lipase [Tripterygium wilfordii]
MEFIVLFLLFSLINNIYSSEATDVKKLFVFGDSLVDVGNFPDQKLGGFDEPYGMTFPGKPSGRFSDGRVLSDYIASFLGLEAPVAFKARKITEKSKIENGMNFACSGSAVLDHPVIQPRAPNMTEQIDYFQAMLDDEKLFTKDDLQSSIAFINIGVNDYIAHKRGDNITSLPNIAAKVIDQLVLDIKRIQDLGMPKIALATLIPLGCAPTHSIKSPKKCCDEEINKIIESYNQKLKEAVKELKNVEIIDVYGAMTSALNRPAESLKFDPLEQCCGGSDFPHFCGKEKGEKKMYKVCDDPKLSIFWDYVHPSQNGWELIYSALKPSLNVLFN